MNLNAPSFNVQTLTAKISSLEEKQHTDNEEFFGDFLSVFKEIGKLNKELKFFSDREVKTVVLLFGEIGNGKSTFGNAISKY